MPKPPKFEPFKFAPNGPLAAEHAAVAKWIEDSLISLGENNWYRDVDLKSLPSGQRLLEGKPEQSLQYVRAALTQVRYWDQEAKGVLAQAKTESERVNAHHLPGWGPVWGRRRKAEAVISALLRRTLPLEKDDLLTLLEWCSRGETVGTYFAPLGHITRALQRHAEKNPPDALLRAAMKQFAVQLRSSYDKEAKRLGTAVEQLVGENHDQPETGQSLTVETKPSPVPAPAGHSEIFVPLKQLLGMLPKESEDSATIIDPDRFPLRRESPLREEHRAFSELFDDMAVSREYYRATLEGFAHGRAILKLEPALLADVLVAALERHVNALLTSTSYSDAGVWQSRHLAATVAGELLATQFEVFRPGLFDLLLYLSCRPLSERERLPGMTARLIDQASREAGYSPLTEGERYVLSLFRASLIAGPPLGTVSDEVRRLTQLIDDGARFFLAPGEAWSDTINADLTRLPAKSQQQWVSLIRHALTATSPRPSAKWLTAGSKLLDAIGGDAVCEALARWFPLLGQGRTIRPLGRYVGDMRGTGDVINEENANALRGFLWLAQALPNPTELTRPISAAALSAYKKVPGIGPRAVKVGNAAVYALSGMGTTEAVGQLAMLKVRIKFGAAQKEIEKAFNTAAAALGLPRDQIEELGVPSYGLEESGRRREDVGDYRAEIAVSGSNAELAWYDAAGKRLKSTPARVKSEHKEDLKELQQSLKDIQAMLPAQRDRIDALFLLQKTWPIDEWRERYHNHPLVGTIARRLLWCVDGAAALFVDGNPTDLQGRAIEHGRTAEISLWHPAGRSLDEVTSWRKRLEELQITQPFKQAHREVYLLTDAERNTQTYSNRFAAHVLRQHQFNALCAARGWKNRLRLMVDDSYPPASRELPLWNLRAEFWVEGIGEDYGAETNESGVYLRIATDQVRFYRTGAAENFAHAGGGGYFSGSDGPGEGNVHAPLPLEAVPPLVFSEIMRDVDLFVGVASVGNDPTWQDGGPQGRYRDYWHGYSFGELSGTAATRKQVLERLVPRLKIAGRCAFNDRFLVVRGDKRTYKIHMGSGNILMEPNDQYLCIVPDSRSRASQDEIFLPFEGDNTLSIIISKALLLADDRKIKDPTITRQIDGA